jgi:ubiquinone/menaquinone biosynthesis C-methylase UbiE
MAMNRLKVSVQEGYARWASAYDAYPNPLIIAEQPIVRRLLGDVRGKRVLDVACGTGRHAVWLHEQGGRVTAVDASPEMLAIARAKLPGADYRQGDVARLPVEDSAFDLVLNALVMEHVEAVEPALCEAHRVLAPGGALVLSVYHAWFLMKGVPPHFRSDEGSVEYEMPAWVHMPSEYLRALIRLGMRLTDVLEPLVDDALIAARPNMEKHRGAPIALIFRAEKAKSS